MKIPTCPGLTRTLRCATLYEPPPSNKAIPDPDALVQFVKTGKLDFKSLADSIASDIIRISARQAIAGTFGNGSSGSGFLAGLIGTFGGLFSGGAGLATNNTGTSLPTSGGRAIGGPVSAGSTYRVNSEFASLNGVAGVVLVPGYGPHHGLAVSKLEALVRKSFASVWPAGFLADLQFLCDHGWVVLR